MSPDYLPYHSIFNLALKDSASFDILKYTVLNFIRNSNIICVLENVINLLPIELRSHLTLKLNIKPNQLVVLRFLFYPMSMQYKMVHKKITRITLSPAQPSKEKLGFWKAPMLYLIQKQ